MVIFLALCHKARSLRSLTFSSTIRVNEIDLNLPLVQHLSSEQLALFRELHFLELSGIFNRMLVVLKWME